MKFKLWVALLLLFALPVLALACGGKGDGGNGGRDEEATSRWVDLLAHVPDTPETRGWVIMNDYARARDAFGIRLPEIDANAETIADYTEALMLEEGSVRRGLAPKDVCGRHTVAPEEWRSQLGFTIANVDQEVRTEVRTEAAHEFYTVMRGRFEQATIDQAVRSDPLFSDLLEEASHSGVDYYTWGEDFAINRGPNGDPRTSSVRPGGVGHRLAVRGDYLYWTASTEGMEGLIDAGLRERRCLADLEHYRLLAQGLDRLETFTAFFPDATDTQVADPTLLCGFGCTQEAFEEAARTLEAEPRLLPYGAFATGAGVDDDGAYLAVVLVHADEQTAEKNAEWLEQRISEGTSFAVSEGEPWSELFHDTDIFSEGSLVLAKLYTDRTMLWNNFVVLGDPLLLH